MTKFGIILRKFLNAKMASLLVPMLALAISLSYFVVKSDDFLAIQSNDIEPDGFLNEINAGQKYVQEIHSEENRLRKISVFLATFGRKNSSHVYLSLSDKEGNVINSWKLSIKLLKDEYYTLALDRPIRRSKDQVYYLTVTSDAKAGDGITVYTRNGVGGLSLNGQDTGKSLCYRLIFKKSYAKLFKNANGFHFIVLFSLAIMLFTLLSRLSKAKIERIFLTMWMFLSLMYLFSGALYRIPDEFGHLCRAFEVSYMHAVSEINSETGAGGRELPLDIDWGLLQRNWQSFSDHKDLQLSKNPVFCTFSNLSLYSPVSYIPQAFGIFISRHLTSNVAVISYSGRLCNWLFITLVLYSAIRLIPVGKEILALIALMPMNMQESVSLAPDGQVVAVSMLIVSFVVYLRHRQADKMNGWQYVLLYLPALMISQLKIVYLPFILLYFLIPDACFGGRRKKIYHVAAIGMLAVASNLIWLSLCSKFLTIAGTDASVQLQYLLHHPFYYFTVLARTYLNESAGWMNTMVGIALAELNVPTVGIFVLAYICMLAHKFCVSSKRKCSENELIENGIFGVVVISIILLISTSLYLQWTSPYYINVVGVQGRYFIPLLCPLFFALNNPSCLPENGNGTNSMSVSVSSFVACINFCACIALLFSSIA